VSIEKLARRALRRAVFWRCVVAVVDLPSDLFNALANFFHRIADLFDNLSDAAFYCEADAARNYRTLTGVDLGYAAKGDIQRYAGTNPKALAQAESDFEDEMDDDD
jgi:hypothetical protein